jgi:ATP-dependent helicase/nuclease subunit A
VEVVELTPEQAGIVAEGERDLVVTAGAGSGKTHVLVERYLKLLDNCRIDQIAAVTFTDAAAAEMRERVRRAVLQRPELAHHRSMMDDAVIGTIHSLCRRILREHPVEAALDPNAQVLADDQAEAAILSASVGALEGAANTGGQQGICLRDLGVWNLKELLPSMVSRRDEVRKAYDKMPGSTVQEWGSSIRAMMDATLAERVALMREPVGALINTVRAMFSGDENDLLWGKVQAAIDLIGPTSTGDASGFAERLVSAFGLFNLRGGSAKNWSGDIAAAKADLKALREIALDADAVPQWNEYDEPALIALQSLRLVFEDACTRYAHTKAELVAVDFLDLELRVQELLDTHPEVAADYHCRFKHLLVDELQDSNPTQVRLIELLTQSADPNAPVPKRFLVGDIKQAIYRFRGSEIAQFRDLRDDVARRGTTHALSRSFRAHDSLVVILNELFESVFGEAREPYEAPMEPMTGRGGPSPAGPHLTVIPITKDSDLASIGTQVSRLRRAEGEQVAAQITSLLALPKQVWDKSLQIYRHARPGDIAILLRSLGDVHVFERALESRSIPYRTPGGAGFFTRQEVLDLTNLLSWLAEPDDEIALVGILRSPLFMIDDASLLKLRYQSRNFLSALSAPPSEFAADVYGRCIHAAAVLNELREAAMTQSADLLLERALVLTDFEASWAPLRSGDQVLGNIRKLVGITRQLSDQSLDEVVDYLKMRRDELNAKENLAVVDDADAVRLMSVHGAKGLEFPIVFIPEADVYLRSSADIVRWRSNNGISLTLSSTFDPDATNRPKPGFYSYLADLDRQEDAAEYKRLFYVAATRAGDALFVSGDASAPEESWLGYALNALAGSALEGIELRDPIQADMAEITHRTSTVVVNPPAVESERDLLPPLIARPRVVPLRSSTPVTALKAQEPTSSLYGHGDQMGLTRGNLAHKAVELWFRSGSRPDLNKVLNNLEEAVDPLRISELVADVEKMLDLLVANPLFATLGEAKTTAYFELPFSWDWDGVPIHGTIDLAYKANDAWHVIDFKTDQLRGRSLEEAANSYLPQLALYAAALEKATGAKPETGLLFLRTGEHYTPTTSVLEQALLETRARIELGGVLEIPVDDEQLVITGEI